METPYKKQVRYLFNVSVGWAVTSYSPTLIVFEETRKNGQEDTHMEAEAELINGKWKLTYTTLLEEYGPRDIVERLEDFFNQNGIPGPEDVTQ